MRRHDRRGVLSGPEAGRVLKENKEVGSPAKIPAFWTEMETSW